jgi:ADP-ribosyl-[dinitrogen reductase] hydrolase
MTEDKKKDMIMGCLIGLAVGDAYGTTYEFKNRFEMPSEDQLPDEIVGAGPFNLNPGDWTDDTSMALCLAESIVEHGWNPRDQMKRYIKWWQHGHNSVNGECFDIGGATRKALAWFNMTEGREFVKDTQAAGNGVLMRLAAIPMILHGETNAVLESCAYQSMMTHPSSQSVECSMLMGAMIDKILSGERDKRKIASFETLLDESGKQYYQNMFTKHSCHINSGIDSIKKVEYDGVDVNADGNSASRISGDGYCVKTLEAALWAFLSTDSFKAGLKRVVSLGDDTDTTGAVYGQIAGAYYGLSQIPWREKITWSEKIHKLAETLYEQNKERRNGLK